MQFKNELALAGFGMVFIVGLHSAPEDVKFTPFTVAEKGKEMELKTSKVDSTMPLKKIGMFRTVRCIWGIKLLSTGDKVITEELWYPDHPDAKWEYQDVPNNSKIVGYYGRVEEDVITSLGFIVI